MDWSDPWSTLSKSKWIGLKQIWSEFWNQDEFGRGMDLRFWIQIHIKISGPFNCRFILKIFSYLWFTILTINTNFYTSLIKINATLVSYNIHGYNLCFFAQNFVIIKVTLISYNIYSYNLYYYFFKKNFVNLLLFFFGFYSLLKMKFVHFLLYNLSKKLFNLLKISSW